MNRKKIWMSLCAFISIAFLFVGCLPTESQLSSYAVKYDLFYAKLQQNVVQSISWKFALPYSLPPGTFSIKGQLKTAAASSTQSPTFAAGQFTTRIEIIRKGHDLFSKDGTLPYDSLGRFHGSNSIDPPGIPFQKNDILKISFTPDQTFTNVHQKFTFTYKVQQ
jgi:hypothetical protein